MTEKSTGFHPMEDPEAQLERAFIDDTSGCTAMMPNQCDRCQAQVIKLLEGASIYAAGKLAEFDSRGATTFRTSTPKGRRQCPAKQRRLSSSRRRRRVADPMVARRDLSDAGNEVVAVTDAASADRSSAHAAVPFDVALLDFRLPDSNDLTLLARLRGLTPTTRMILVTACRTPEIFQAALELDAYCFLHKPFERMLSRAPLVTRSHVALLRCR
jgi:CheY-like chemotaxis protein